MSLYSEPSSKIYENDVTQSSLHIMEHALKYDLYMLWSFIGRNCFLSFASWYQWQQHCNKSFVGEKHRFLQLTKVINSFHSIIHRKCSTFSEIVLKTLFFCTLFHLSQFDSIIIMHETFHTELKFTSRNGETFFAN